MEGRDPNPMMEHLKLLPESLRIPEKLDMTFEGFGRDAFEILNRLRQHPHIDVYRKEKSGIKSLLQEPFRRYRDDLVVNWVLPNRLPFETERNVFSRILKNDFGAGGTHSHLWMSFYRLGRQRLTDYQIIHSISPEGFSIGLYFGANAPNLFKDTKTRILGAPSGFLTRLNPLLQRHIWQFIFITGTGMTKHRHIITEPMENLPGTLTQAKRFWIRTLLPRDDVVRLKGSTLKESLKAVCSLWPLYLFYLGDM